MMFVVFDLDGTLADCEHRLHHIQGDEKRSPEQWDAFFEACPKDSPITHTISVLKALVRAEHRVEIWSARSDQVRRQTEDWLCAYGVFVPLRMRRAGDHRDDDSLKCEWVNAHGFPNLVFEDRARVVKMWRAMGVPCFHVAAGEF
jgi:FMN phosphatase YigB (HAD superfamily)